jgi:transposase
MSETVLAGAGAASGDTGPEITPLGEGRMVREDCWRQVHRLFHVEQRAKAEIARQLGLDRKTVRAILQATAWQPYTRAEPVDRLLTAHTTYLQSRAPQVQYSARILFQELRQSRSYRGSYETVKRFVRPLRDVEQAAERATVRFETPPGQQSQIDWGQARIHYRSRPQDPRKIVDYATVGFEMAV